MSFFKKLFAFFKKKEKVKTELSQESTKNESIHDSFENGIQNQNDDEVRRVVSGPSETAQSEKIQEANVEEEKEKGQSLPWIDTNNNEWGIKVLDLRSISQEVIATSQNPEMASNAISYNGKDGTEFWGIKPQVSNIISSNITFPIDEKLQPGVLFIPDSMDRKWAIYFDGMYLIFVRSWLREVFVIAKTSQKNNQLIIENIMGEFVSSESSEFNEAVLRFLIISHVLNEEVPAPLSKIFENDTYQTGLWAFSLYGNMANFGTFDESFIPRSNKILRSDSLLHYAVLQSNLDEIVNLLRKGISIDSLASDGFTPLHWAIYNENTDLITELIELGADSNVRSLYGTTPIMIASEQNKIKHILKLLKSGAFVNAKDNRGFTALHRASEMNHVEIVKLLLANKADKTIVANGNTALSLAIVRDNKEIIELLAD